MSLSSMSGTCEGFCGSTQPTTMVRGLIAHWASRLPPDRPFRLPRNGQAGSSFDRCWVVCTTSTSGWPLDLCRYGWSFAAPQVSSMPLEQREPTSQLAATHRRIPDFQSGSRGFESHPALQIQGSQERRQRTRISLKARLGFQITPTLSAPNSRVPASQADNLLHGQEFYEHGRLHEGSPEGEQFVH